MTRDEFKKQLDQLIDAISRGLYYYEVEKKLRYYEKDTVSWSRDEQYTLLGRYKGFFTPVCLALHDMTLMQFVKVFDTDSQTASLTNLLAAVGQDPVVLVPRVTAADVRTESKKLQQHKKIITVLKRLRNQRLAHMDASPAPLDPVLIGEFETLLKGVKAAVGFLSSAHAGQALAWELWEGSWDTTRVMGILIEDSKVADAAMEASRS